MRNLATLFTWQYPECTQTNGLISYGVIFASIDGVLQLATLRTLNEALIAATAATSTPLEPQKVDEDALVAFVDEWLGLADVLKPLQLQRLGVTVLLKLVEETAATGVQLLLSLSARREFFCFVCILFFG